MPEQQVFQIILHDKGQPEGDSTKSELRERIFYSGETIKKEIGTSSRGDHPYRGFSGKRQ
jgi:hypothetical protein